jgi:hypothetical protein
MYETREAAQKWESYLREVIPAAAPDVQIQECRRAFYAGAQGMFTAMYHVSTDDISEDQGAEHLEELNQELQAFATDVAAGRA